MLGLLYLILVWLTGLQMVQRWIFPQKEKIIRRSLAGHRYYLPRWIWRFPAAWVVGMIASGWICYVASYFFAWLNRPVFDGSIITLLLLSLNIGWLLRGGEWNLFERDDFRRPAQIPKFFFWRAQFFPLALVLVTLFWQTFTSFYLNHGAKGENGEPILRISYTLCCDLRCHDIMIRSFSHGSNFPTQYPFFADGTVRYHFLYDFFVAGIETLGWRIDWAYNIPSIVSFVAMVLLLYTLALRVTGQLWVGILTTVLFCFRSSGVPWLFLYHHFPFDPAEWKVFTDAFFFIGEMPYGGYASTLSPLPVYLNQRHLAVGFGVVILALLKVLEWSEGEVFSRAETWKQRKRNFFSLAGWKFCRWKEAAALGVLMGAAFFWNGVAIFIGLLILAGLALFSRHRLNYMGVAAITLAFAELETLFFVPQGEPLIHPAFFLGFMGRYEGFGKLAHDYFDAFGFFPLLVLAGVFLLPRRTWPLAFAFFLPILFISLVHLTPFIGINHKFFNLGIELLNIFPAYLIFYFIKRGLRRMRRAVHPGLMNFSVKQDWLSRFGEGVAGVTMIDLGFAIFFILTIMGFLDLFPLYHQSNNVFSDPSDDEVIEWIEAHTSPRAVFLTAPVIVNRPLMAGRLLYIGCIFPVINCGYDFNKREDQSKAFLREKDPVLLRKMLGENGIDYVLMDDDFREKDPPRPDESIFDKALPLVFASAIYHTKIYRVGR